MVHTWLLLEIVDGKCGMMMFVLRAEGKISSQEYYHAKRFLCVVCVPAMRVQYRAVLLDVGE
jgi:hypothetical protein